jgi:hypothetical protein
MIPSHIKLAAIVADRLYRDGLLPRPSAEWLFDVVADALAAHPDMSAILTTEIEFAREALHAKLNARELWADLELPSDETK